MQNFDLYKPLVELSAAVSECRKELQGDLSWKRRADLRKIARSLENKLTEQSEALIYLTLNTWEAEESLGKFLSDELNALKSGTEQHWHPEIDNVKVRLCRLAEVESRKSPLRRRFDRYGWIVAIVFVVVGVLSVRWISMVDVYYPPETAEGVVQGSAALEKLARYDATLGEGLDDVGLFKRIVLWPVKPTDREVGYALDFMQTTVEVYDALKAENRLCGADLVHQTGEGSSADELAIARIVVAYINGPALINNAESGTRLMEKAFKGRFYCS